MMPSDFQRPPARQIGVKWAGMLRPKVQSVVGAGLILRFALGGAACAKKSAQADRLAAPEFDKKWAELAKAGTEVAYIEDDRGEGLMGNVRRASPVKAEPPAVAPAEANVGNPRRLPDQPPGEQVQRIIRGNLMAVRGCFMSMARTGQARSGKAIVSFTIGADGAPPVCAWTRRPSRTRRYPVA
jgi:hypothetical protein